PRSPRTCTARPWLKVSPAYTSQRCSACGFVSEGNRESQAVFRGKATGCGHAEHADVNAAKNTRHAGGQPVETSALAGP
ncbi:zinc ribbon domain-containing protein, partial [Streptomyces sp. NPDC051133]|uniref:zinc ribbon domain-containing protein n=1 Tax=Streptomyces sp. NPDC051133 TaxID=3155521 RepID=UPI00342B5DA4